MSTTALTILHGGHRKVMRIGANESMSTVVQAACREFGLDAGAPNLVLKHKRAVVDLSQPFRFTGIPQNATLELAEEAPTRRRGPGGAAGSGAGGGQVRVAMRLPGGGRVQASFSPDTSLLGLLQWWAGRGELVPGVLEQGPSLQFMRTAYGAGELGSTTLRSIGLLTGSAMFTLSLTSPGATAASTAGVSSSSPARPAAATAAGATPSTASAKEGPGGGTQAVSLGTTAAAAAANPTPAAAVAPSGGSGAAKPPGVSAASPAAVGLSAQPSSTATAAAAAGTEGANTPTTDAAAATDKEGGMRVDGGGGMKQEQEGAPAAEAMEMEVETDPSPSVPTMGIEVCQAALEAMAAGHFDADSEACVTTLAKVVDNVLHRPGDARTRQIRCGNAAFQHKVGRITGGIAFLEGAGFVSQNEVPQQLLGGGGGGGGGAGDRFLVLTPDREDAGLLKQARALLSKQAEALGVPRERMPKPPQARPAPPPAASGQAAFDPYKPFMTSTAPTPKGPQEQSLTEKRLQELLAKRADVVAGGVPDRNIQVTLPSLAAAAAPAAGAGAGGSGAGGGSFGGGGGGGGEGEGGDGGLLAKKMARQIAERKKREEVPFQTKAMREIERLQKATVYRTTVIKVQFPDRVVLQATFASSEGVKDLLEVVQSSLGETGRHRQFELYVSPPRAVLKATSTLSDAGLVPAALVYVSWRDVPPTGEAEGGYLKRDLTSGLLGTAAGTAAARPVGVALDGGAKGAEESKRGGGNRLGGGSSGGGSGGSSGGGKKKGKPSWLKIN